MDYLRTSPWALLTTLHVLIGHADATIIEPVATAAAVALMVGIAIHALRQ